MSSSGGGDILDGNKPSDKILCIEKVVPNEDIYKINVGNTNDDEDDKFINFHDIFAHEKRKICPANVAIRPKKLMRNLSDKYTPQKNIEKIDIPINIEPTTGPIPKMEMPEYGIKNDKMKLVDDNIIKHKLKKMTPKPIQLTANVEGYAMDRVVESVKNTVVPVTVADLFEISPSCKQRISKEMKSRIDINVQENFTDKNGEWYVSDNEYTDEDPDNTPTIGKIYVKVADEEFLAAIDPGADVSMVHPSTLQYLGFEANTKSKNILHGFAGSIDTKESITDLPVQVAQLGIPMNFQITSHCPYPILLGRDWMFKSEAKTDWQTGEMNIKYRGKSVRINMYKLGYVPYAHRWKRPFQNSAAKEVVLQNEKEMLFAEKLLEIRTQKEWEYMKDNTDEFGFVIAKSSLQSKSILFNEKPSCNILVSEQIEIGDAFTGENRKKIKELVDSYPKLFCENLEDMRRLKVPPMNIDVGDAKPIKCPSYRIPVQHLPILKKQLQELVEQKVITKQPSEWSAPLLMVKKKDGSWRLVADYRKLNGVSIKDAGEVPVIQDLIDRASGSKIFSAMDCKSGFWQWEISKESIDKTGFSTPFGSYCYLVCPMGFTNAAQGFHRIVTGVFDDMIAVSVEVIIDDVFVHSKNILDHMRDLESVFERAEKANMTFKINKTRLGLKKINIWSWVISEDGICADPNRVSIVKEYPIPSTVKQIRQFIGFANYFRRVVPRFSHVAAPLTDLLKRDGRIKVTLSEREINSFNELKRLLTSNTVVKHPDQNKVFYVKSDAGPQAVGAVLSQFHDSLEYPVAYTSSKLNIHQRNYGQTKKELLAVVIAFETWRHYLIDTKFPIVLVTDCTAVRDIMKKKKLTGIFARWVFDLQDFNFVVVYKPGREHSDADAMSRMFDAQGGEGDMNMNEKKLYFSEVFYSEAQETYLDEIELYLNKPGEEDIMNLDSIRKQSEKFVIDKKGILFRKNKDGIPRKVIKSKADALSVLKLMHDNRYGGHLGIQNTLKRLKIRFWWPKINEDVAMYIKNCRICQIRDRKRKEEPMPLIKATQLFEKWGGDCIGPLESAMGFSNIVLWTDYHSKWITGRAIRSVDSRSIAKSLIEDIILEHGVPIEIVTDRAGGFIGGAMKEVKENWEIKGIRTSSYNARSNGQAERTNQSTINILAKVTLEYKKKWPEILPFAIWVMNTTINRSTGYSPYFLKYGVDPRLPIDLEWDTIWNDEMDIDDAIMKRLEDIIQLRGKRTEVLERLQLGYETRRLKRLEDTHLRIEPLLEGDKVLLWRSELDKQWSGKLEPRWKGPFVIVRIYHNGTYDIGELSGEVYKHNPVSGRFLKKYNCNEDNDHEEWQ